MAGLPPVVFDGVIDVSHHNGVIDWGAVARAGIALAMIKATEGAGFTDPRFLDNRKGALDAGLMVIPYHFLRAKPMGREQAPFFLNIVKPARGDILMLDWERASDGFPALATMIEMGEEIEAATGRAPITYYGYSVIGAADDTLSGWPFMIPAYPRDSVSGGTYKTLVTSAPRMPPGRPADRPYEFHQYTQHGRIAGISGDVDRSIWVGDLASLKEWFGGAPSVPAQSLPSATQSSAGPGDNPIELIRQAQRLLGTDDDGDPGPETRTKAAAYRVAHPGT